MQPSAKTDSREIIADSLFRECAHDLIDTLRSAPKGSESRNEAARYARYLRAGTKPEVA